MFHLITASLAAFALSLVLVPLCRTLARGYGFVATPRADRWHARPTALLGGVAIATTVLALHVTFIGVTGLPILLVAGLAMFAIGLIDDIVSLKPATKLVFEIAVASFLAFFGYRLGWVQSQTLDTLITVFWIVGLTNAFNLLDNMDGLCAGLAVVAGTGVLAALWLNGVAGPIAIHLALLTGAAAGFLVYNFNPASIFMGDSGSLFLGLNLSVMTLSSPSTAHVSSSLISIVAAPLLILLVPILDTTLVTVSRILAGRSAAQGGRDHSSHRLVAIGLSERSAVLVLWALGALGGLLGVSLKHYRGDLPSLVSAVFVIAAIIFGVYLAHVRVYAEDEATLQRAGRVTPLVVHFVYRRRIAEVLLDLCLTAIAYYSAYRLRFGNPGEFGGYFPQFLQSLPLVMGVQLVSLFAVGGYRGVWQYFGLMDGVTFAKGVGLGTLLNIAVLTYVYRFEAYSRGVFVIYAALLMLLLAGSRASFRLMSEFAHRRNQRGLRVVIYGAGDVAASAVRDILSRREGAYRMLGFILEDPSMERAQMQGYPVIGNYQALLGMVDEGGVDLVVITQLIDVERLEALRARCVDRGVSLERLHFRLDQLVAAS
ncbi:MAG: glycosyl transferase [Acidobacteria bacterium]|nr:glycosyl transferase [Acidobacteriota bacterium]